MRSTGQSAKEKPHVRQEGGAAGGHHRAHRGVEEAHAERRERAAPLDEALETEVRERAEHERRGEDVVHRPRRRVLVRGDAVAADRRDERQRDRRAVEEDAALGAELLLDDLVPHERDDEEGAEPAGRLRSGLRVIAAVRGTKGYQ